QCMTLYAQSNDGYFPRTGYNGPLADSTSPDLTNIGNNANDPFGSANPFDGLNNIPSVFYLLARTEGVQLAAFVCPSSGAEAMNLPGGGISQHRNFDTVPGGGNVGNLSYSIENPYPGSNAVIDAFRWKSEALGADFAIAADLNPG